MDLSNEAVMKDVEAGVSPKKYENLPQGIFAIVLAEYFHNNKKILVKYYREKGLSQNEIGEKLGISQSSVSRFLEKVE